MKYLKSITTLLFLFVLAACSGDSSTQEYEILSSNVYVAAGFVTNSSANKVATLWKNDVAKLLSD